MVIPSTPATSSDSVHRSGLLPVLLILLLALCVVLTGCGQAADVSGLSGSYDLAGATDGGFVLTDEAALAAPVHFRLDPGGTGIVTDGERTGRLTWSESEGFVIIEAGGVLLGGNTEGTDLLLKAAGSDTVLRFTPSDPEVSSSGESDSAGVSAEVETDENPPSLHSQLFTLNSNSLSWYGWWKITDTDGSMPMSWYDCCARLTQMEPSAYRLIIWDEDGSEEEPLASVIFREEGEGHLVSLYGTWLYDDIEYGEWELDLPCEVLWMEDLRHDAENTAFTYSFYLRSWGDRWKDSPEEQLPFYFDDWYLPLLKKGAEMPDRIPVAAIEKERETIHG